MNAISKLMTPEAFGLTVPDGLVYRDINHVPLRVWNWMMGVMEPFGLVVLANTVRKWSDGTVTARGQIFVEEDGLKALSFAFAEDKDGLFPSKNKDPNNVTN